MKKRSILICCFLICLFSIYSYMFYQKLNQDNFNDSLLIAQNDQELPVTGNNDYKIYKTESQNEVTYNVVDFERDLSYSWSFAKEKEDTPLSQAMAMDMNLRLNIDQITNDTNYINSLVDQDKLIVSFDYHGNLPTNAKIKLNVQDKFKDGDKLYLYYYNPELYQVEFIDKDIKVKNGYIEFDIEHCSDYFLTASIVNEAVNNPKNINYIIIGLGVIVFILIAITLFQSKK